MLQHELSCWLSITAIEAIEVIEAIEAIETIEATETIEAIEVTETIEANETMKHWNYWAEARLKIARMTLTIKRDGNWSSFQLANSAPPLSVTDSAIAPSARMSSIALPVIMLSNKASTGESRLKP